MKFYDCTTFVIVLVTPFECYTYLFGVFALIPTALRFQLSRAYCYTLTVAMWHVLSGYSP